MTTESTFAPEYLAAAREWFEEVLQAARAVHAIGERGAAEGILLALDRWLLARDVSSGPSAELAMVVQAILGDDVMRPFGPYDPATSVLGNPWARTSPSPSTTRPPSAAPSSPSSTPDDALHWSLHLRGFAAPFSNR